MRRALFRQMLLERRWLRPEQMPWSQPLDPIKEYLGEKVGVWKRKKGKRGVGSL